MKTLSLFILVLLCCEIAFSQSVGLGTTTPNPSAALDITSTAKGVLLPRLTQTQRDAIPSPAQGLLLYNITANCFQVNLGTPGAPNWQCLTTANAADRWGTTGNSGTSETTNFIGTTDSMSLHFKVFNQKAGKIGFNSTFFGYKSGQAPNDDGSSNTGFGSHTLTLNTSGVYNTAIGIEALEYNTTGSSNVAVGVLTLANNAAGYQNTATGNASLLYNTAGSQNTAVGFQALAFNTTGSSNVAIGRSAMENNVTSDRIVAVGDSALYNNAAYENTALGSRSLKSTTSGFGNTGVGSLSLYANTTGFNNTGIGNKALKSNTGSRNTAIGSSSMFSSTSGANNTAAGTSSLVNNTTGGFNCAIGSNALFNNTSGTYNNAVGADALVYNTTGINNTAIGDLSGQINVSGSGNTFIGRGANPAYDSLVNATAIGLNAVVATNNSVILGDYNLTSVGIGTQSATNRLDISNGSRIGSHPAGRPLYVTGDILAASNGIEFRHLDGTQGIGFGYNTIYAAGSDPNQNLGLSAKGTTGHLLFTTNSIESMRIQADGRVGIGTSLPNEKLEIGGTGRAFFGNGAGANRYGILIDGDGPNNASRIEAWNYSTGTGRSLLLNSLGGNVGIGLNNPSFKLHVSTPTDQYGICHTGGFVEIVSWTSPNYGAMGTRTNHPFRLFANDGAQQFEIMPNGNIGIGLHSAQNKLDISSGVARTGTHPTGRPLYVTGNLGAESDGIEFRLHNGIQGIGFGYNTIYTTGTDQTLGLSAMSSLIFKTNNIQRMVITNNGFVGIGTNAPLAPLQFSNGLGNKKIVLYDASGNDHQFFGFGVNVDGTLRYQVNQNSSDHVFYAATSASTSSELFRVKGNGNIAVQGAIETEAYVLPALQNSFVNFGITWEDVGYYKDKMNRVHLRGFLSQLLNNGAVLTIFTLPTGYRPAGTLTFLVFGDTGPLRVDVNADGTVMVWPAGSTYDYLSLSGISFKVP